MKRHVVIEPAGGVRRLDARGSEASGGTMFLLVKVNAYTGLPAGEVQRRATLQQACASAEMRNKHVEHPFVWVVQHDR